MITIRESGKDDATAISGLMIPVATAQIAAEFPPQGKELLLSGMQTEALRLKMTQGYRYFQAQGNDGLCGVIGMRGYSHVYHLFVASDHQGKGIARLLWERASQASLTEILLSEFTVFSSRVAEGFYHRMGFRRTGEELTRLGVTGIPMRLIHTYEWSKE